MSESRDRWQTAIEMVRDVLKANDEPTGHDVFNLCDEEGYTAWKAVRDMLDTRKSLEQTIESAMRNLNEALPYLRGESACFNRLGLLQGRGSEIDRLTGEFGLRVEFATAAIAASLKAMQLAGAAI